MSAAAARDIADAARRDPRWAKARALAAEAAFRSGERAKALAHASAAVKANPYSARLRLLRAKAALWAGRRAAAARDLDEALRLVPGHDEARRLRAALAAGRAPVVTTLLEELPDGGVRAEVSRVLRQLRVQREVPVLLQSAGRDAGARPRPAARRTWRAAC